MQTKTKLRFIPVLVVAVVLSIFDAKLRAADAPSNQDGAGHMTAEERAKAIKLLNDSEARTLDLLKNLSDEQLNFKPATNKWSVLEVAEHIMLSESEIFAAVQKTLESEPNPDWESKTKGKTEFLETAMLNRTHKAQAPEALVPTGKLSREEVVARFKEARARTLKFVEETQLPVKTYTRDHPVPVFGTLNAYQWLILIPLHNERHNLQIDEVIANPNFPKSRQKAD
jgi:uncharacterized damage-inducible protein DinB